MSTFKKYIALFFVLTFIPALGFAQTDPAFYDYPQNHLDWFTIESTHFMIHFQEGNSRSAKIVSRISEEIYKPITDLYQFEPGEKVSIVLKDREDYSNGAAYFFDNKIDIWLPALDTPLRGTHNWLRNVISHEFTHIVQIQKGMKRSRKIPAFYLQWLSYEDVRRPDVLYGFPNGIVTLPFATVNIPAWLAEGTAQYQTAGLFYETWDSHRDMILRTRIMTDTYFSLEEMATFSSKTSIERETVYNQGYAFVIYLANTYGEDILRQVTEALSQRKVYSVANAIEIATGTPGEEVFENWINERKSFYAQATAGINETTSDYVEKLGFFNFYPKLSPDGKKLAYLSNKGVDFSLMSLYIVDANGEKEVAVVNHLDSPEKTNHTDAVKPLVSFLSTSFSFSPDGNKIAYTINKRNKYGENYRDVFIYDLETEKSKRLTHSARIESPTWSPKGDKIAAAQYFKGTQNLVFLYPDHPDSVTKLTDHKNGETVFTPEWTPDATQIYYARAERSDRDIYVYDVNEAASSPYLTDPYVDYRDPEISANGEIIYFSSNPDGIFNIYRQPVSSPSDQEKLTSVNGGVFMPEISAENQLYFSEYEASGYKIKTVIEQENEARTELGFYDPDYPERQNELNPTYDYTESLNDFDDSDIEPFTEEAIAIADTGSYQFEIETLSPDEKRTFRSYEDTYTGFSFFPVLRFDNYSKKNGNNGALIKNGKFGQFGENLLRDMKPGVYMSSRDVIDRLSLFGGIMLGVASKSPGSVGGFFQPSHLFGLDRDAFLIAEHRGLPFIERSWSPTVSLEIYNLRRNVSDGLSIEEFPCTSCLPDTLNADIAYDIWEANLFLRSKINRMSLLELGIGYSPYRVSTDNFYSRELKAFVSGSSEQYFRGTRLSAAYTFDYYLYSTDGDIAPVGLKGYLRYQYEPSKLLEEYEIKEGALSPIYKTSKNHSAELHVRYGFRSVGGQAFQARVRAFNYFNDPDDSFYTDYIGGFMGMRSYPYFALGGNTTAFASLSWFAPIYKNITKQVGPYTLDKLYARFFFETGNGWRSPFETGSNLKSGVGAELRLALNGYYLFPLKFFVSTSYGFNKFTLDLSDDFVTGSGNNRVTYGREFLFHFGLTFDFELL